MKREILFRGKNLYKDEWVYGVPVKTNSLSGVSLITELYHVDGAEYNAIECDIIPETVGQFTGLTDKNGTKIFEGDIISENNGSPMEIVWQEYSCQWIAKYTQKEGRGYRDISHRYCHEYKITGNIHDNPTP